jgi:hypothetical protein
MQKRKKRPLGFSGPRKSSFEPALEGQVQRGGRKPHGGERGGLFGPEERCRYRGRSAPGWKHRCLGCLRRLDHRHTLHLPHPSAIGLTDTGQAREEGSQEKQQFQKRSSQIP